jgi:hypothetical protein
MGLVYALWLLPGTEAFQAAKGKHKAEVSKKPIAKKAKTTASRTTLSKMAPPSKIGVVKVI